MSAPALTDQLITLSPPNRAVPLHEITLAHWVQREVAGTAISMRILAADTSTKIGSVALVQHESLVAEYTLNVCETHSARPMPTDHSRSPGTASWAATRSRSSPAKGSGQSSAMTEVAKCSRQIHWTLSGLLHRYHLTRVDYLPD
jgi:hypothetical protein